MTHYVSIISVSEEFVKVGTLGGLKPAYHRAQKEGEVTKMSTTISPYHYFYVMTVHIFQILFKEHNFFRI